MARSQGSTTRWAARVGVSLLFGATVVAATTAFAGERGQTSNDPVEVAVLPVPAMPQSVPPASDEGALQHVTVTPVPGHPETSQPASDGVLQQQLAVTILPGGLTFSPHTLTATLTRDGDGHRYIGTIGPLTVTDARGSLAGWTAALRLAGGPPGGHILVQPTEPVAVTGNSGEATGGEAAPLRAGQAVTLMSAGAGGGGGTFTVGATLELSDGGPADQRTISVSLMFIAS